MRSSKSQFKEHVLGLWQETKGQRHQQHFRMLPAVPCWTQLPYSKLGMRGNKHIIEDRYHHHIDVQSMCMPYQRKIPAVFPDSKEASLCHPLGSQTDSPTLWFAPVLNKVIEMCETPQKLCNNCKSIITQGELKIRKVISFFFYNRPLNVWQPPLLPHLPQHSSENCASWLKVGDSCPTVLQLFDM